MASYWHAGAVFAAVDQLDVCLRAVPFGVGECISDLKQYQAVDGCDCLVPAVVVSWQLRAAVILPCMHHSPWLQLHFDIQGLWSAFEGFYLAARTITTIRAPSRSPKVPAPHNCNVYIKLA
jgi:hypothetical protein